MCGRPENSRPALTFQMAETRGYLKGGCSAEAVAKQPAPKQNEISKACILALSAASPELDKRWEVQTFDIGGQTPAQISLDRATREAATGFYLPRALGGSKRWVQLRAL